MFVIAVLIHKSWFVDAAPEVKEIVLFGRTSMFLVAVAAAHPPVPATVYVIVATPGATPATTPVELLTVAMAPLLVVQVPPDTVDVKVRVPPIQTV
jgi:hypothetical protein